jgi:hypothetical protein
MINEILKSEEIQIHNKIFTIRGVQVMLDRDFQSYMELRQKG